MTAKEYLSQVESLIADIECTKAEIEYWHNQATSTTIDIKSEPVQGGKASQGFTAASDNAVDIERELDLKIREMYEKRQQILTQVMSMKPEYRKLLYKRYFERSTWEDIAEQMNCSVQWAYTTHGRALKEFEKTFLKTVDESL